MKLRIAGVLALLLAPQPAWAHFKLTSPPDWIVTNADGDPQKLSPCGSSAGMRTNVVTTVRPGQKLKVQWTERVGHPGHYRISIAADRAQLVDPTPVVMMNDCKSAPIQAAPVAPVIADGLFPKIVGATNMMYEHEITIPNMKCDRCTLQVLQFMSKHMPSCFYYHCADIRITDGTDGGLPAADSGTPDRAGSPGDSGGAGGSGGMVGAGGAGGTAGAGSGGRGGAPATGGTVGGEGGAGGDPPKRTASGGCSMATGARIPPVGLMALAGILAALASRRRRR